MNFRKPVLIFAVLIIASLTSSVLAQAGGFVPFAWEQANLALLVPQGWSVATVLRDDQPALEISSEDDIITVQLLADTTPEEGLSTSLEAAFQSLDVIPATFTETQWFGRRALQSQNGTNGWGRAGRLPDRRVLVIAGRGAADATLNAVANSVVFSAQAAPTPPSYALLWLAQIPETINEVGAAVPPQVVDLAYSPLGQLYVLDPTQGVIVLDPATGASLITYPFSNPSEPNSIAIDARGAAYLADTVCRCLQVLANRSWLNPVGSFGSGAPFDVSAAPDGTLYAIDRPSDGYAVSVIANGQTSAIPLNFNGAAAPLLAADNDGNVTVIEWLSSLIDGEINGAVSRLENDAATLQYWLDLAPDAVNDLAISPDGELAVALADGRIAFVNNDGSLWEVAREDAAPRALAFAPDGTLFIARADGSIVARSASLPPERTGDGAIVNDVPVQGTLNENVTRHDWVYEGTAGEQITINAVDLTQTDALDMAVRLTGPDGGERAYNDDQLGLDLYGRFDAQIVDYVLRESGTYAISVEWVQGEGMYTLGVSANHRFELNADNATRLEGTLQEVFPVQRWIFDGQAGQTVTFTMVAESGDLDPALELIQPGGSTMAYNDDAFDPELGVNAQLVRVELPDDGIYVLEASRFEGSGRYTIIALLNSG